MNQPVTEKTPLAYTKYPLARLVSVKEIVSADYVRGNHLVGRHHSHQDAWELCFCMRGEAIYLQDGLEFHLQPGQMMFTAPGVIHKSSVEDPETVSFFIAFTCSDTYIQILHQRIMQITFAQERLLDRLIEELQSAFELKNDRLRIYQFLPDQNSPLGAEQMICCYLEQLLINILREVTMQNNRAVTGEDFVAAMELVKNINRYIDEHLAESITVEKLCDEFHYGRTKLFNVYKKVAGMGVNAYITRQRLERARQMLEQGNCTITKIAEQLGFSTPQYFSAKFSAAYGCTPSQYAERFRINE